MLDIDHITRCLYDMILTLESHEEDSYQTLAAALGLKDLDDERRRDLACALRFNIGAPENAVFYLLRAEGVPVRDWLTEEGRRRQVAAYKAMPYDEYLKTEHWQSARKTILLRDGYRCCVCNSAGPLNVHHRTYERRGEEQPGDLTTLCQSCHEMFHSNGKLAPVEPTISF